MLSATVYRAGAPLQQQRRTPATSATARRAAVQTQALFGFLSPAKSVKGGPSKAQALVDQLLELTERTEGGLNASPSRRQEIEELVGELEAYCPRNPLRSPLLFGDYEVLYASKPQTAGGPYRSPIGRVIFPGQRALQSLQEPNILVNEVCGWVCGCAGDAGELLSGQPWCLLCLPFISLHRGCLHGCCCLLHCYHTLPPTYPPCAGDLQGAGHCARQRTPGGRVHAPEQQHLQGAPRAAAGSWPQTAHMCTVGSLIHCSSIPNKNCWCCPCPA
jgi:hypothetical protein